MLNNPTTNIDPLGLDCSSAVQIGTDENGDPIYGMNCSWDGTGNAPAPAPGNCAFTDGWGCGYGLGFAGQLLDQPGGGGGGGGGTSTPPPSTNPPKKPGPQQSFAGCVQSGTSYFSLQNGLQAIRGGRLGTSWLSSAFLGSNISNFITVGQYVASRVSGSRGPTLGQTASAGGQLAASNVAVAGLSLVPNVSLQASAAVVVAVETPAASTTVGAAGTLSATLPLGSVAGVAADVIGTFSLYKYALDIPVAAFSGIVCSIGR